MAFGEGPFVGALAVEYVMRRRRQGRICGLTASNHRSVLGLFVASVGDRPVERIQRRHVQRWLDTLGELAESTQRQRVGVVRGFWTWLMQEGYVSTDLMADVPTPVEPTRMPRSIPGEESGVARLLVYCPDARARLIVTFAIQLGVRVGEIARQQREWIDWHGKAVLIKGKGKRERVVRLTREAELALRDYLAESPGTTGPLIRSYRRPSKGLAADTVSGLISEWMLSAGVKSQPRDGVSAHVLRHQSAHDMLKRGATIRDVQYVLGHSSSSTTEIYLPRLTGPLERVMEGRFYGRFRQETG